MKENKTSGLKLTCAIIETILAIPIIGGAIILSLIWLPLIASLTMHIITLILTRKSRKMTGNVLGILGATVGLIPFVGWILHTLSAIFCWIEAFNEKK